MSIGLYLAGFTPHCRANVTHEAPQIGVMLEGLVEGEAQPGDPLSGTISGLTGAEVITHRWLADGAEVTDETEATFIPQPGVNVAGWALLHYAPLVDGVEYLSPPAPLAALPEGAAPQSLPRLSGQQRIGAEITLDASMLTDVTGQRYFLDGTEIQGQIGPSILAAFTGALTCEVTTAQGVYVTPTLSILDADHSATHMAMDDAALAIVPHGDASHFAVQDGDWSEAATWDLGSVPEEGAVVVVPIGRTVRYDMPSSVRLDRLRVDGTLTWALDRSTEMLVETIMVQPGGHLVIGDAVTNRLPSEHSTMITISNRAYGIDPDNPTNIDLMNDPTLIGRGILVLGSWTAFGHHREGHVKTAALNLPLTGDIAVTLTHAPENWLVGDRIIIPGTAVDLDANGVNTRYDEERVITDISGSIVSWDAGLPLIHDHDHHNTNVTERAEFQLPISNAERNITIQSEAGAAVHQRGHTMGVHGASNLDLWGVAFIELGRTDKSKPAGVIDGNGDFLYVIAGTQTKATAPLTADANLQSRYPAHGHFMGFKKAITPLIRDCYVEDAKAWGGVHHGCEMDWLANTFYRVQGAGLVAETGDEIGRWDDNLVFGLETTTGAYRFPKGQEEDEGKAGDFAKWGYGYSYRGRAMIVTRNVAVGMTWGHVFYHRAGGLNGGGRINPLRVNLDINDLNIYNGDDGVEPQDYPITHFDRNDSIGCAGALAIVKSAANQGHDKNIKISNFLGWACGRGVGPNYIGGYLLEEILVVRSRFNSQRSYAVSTQSAGFTTGKDNQVAFNRIEAVDFAYGIIVSGADVQGINNSQFSQDDPRFILGEGNDFSTCANPITYEDVGPVTTLSVTKIMAEPITYAARPSVVLPFLIGTFNDGARTFTDTVTATKTDTVSNGGVIPKPWDSAGLSFGNQPQVRLRKYAAKYGVWDYTDGDGAHKIILIPYYWADRLTAIDIKTMQAVKWNGNTSAYPQNGTFNRSSADPVRADITRTVATGMEDSFNVLDAATGEAGTTLSLNIPELVAGLGTDSPAHVKANYGFITVDKGGVVTYKSVPGFVGTDHMWVYVYDGQGRFCTTEITFDVQQA